MWMINVDYCRSVKDFPENLNAQFSKIFQRLENHVIQQAVTN